MPSAAHEHIGAVKEPQCESERCQRGRQREADVLEEMRVSHWTAGSTMQSGWPSPSVSVRT